MDSLGTDWEPIIYGNQIITSARQQQFSPLGQMAQILPHIEYHTVFYNFLQHLTQKLFLR